MKHVHRLQARLSGDARRLPETAHLIDIGFGEIHVRGKLIGEAADFAPAHGVGLTGHRKRPHAGPADAAGREVAVDDGVNLVGAAAGLIDALRIDRHGFFGAGEQAVKLRHGFFI